MGGGGARAASHQIRLELHDRRSQHGAARARPLEQHRGRGLERQQAPRPGRHRWVAEVRPVRRRRRADCLAPDGDPRLLQHDGTEHRILRFARRLRVCGRYKRGHPGVEERVATHDGRPGSGRGGDRPQGGGTGDHPRPDFRRHEQREQRRELQDRQQGLRPRRQQRHHNRLDVQSRQHGHHLVHAVRRLREQRRLGHQSLRRHEYTTERLEAAGDGRRAARQVEQGPERRRPRRHRQRAERERRRQRRLRRDQRRHHQCDQGGCELHRARPRGVDQDLYAGQHGAM